MRIEEICHIANEYDSEGVSLTIPITNGRLNLGAWQCIYLCEFRDYGGERTIVLTVLS